MSQSRRKNVDNQFSPKDLNLELTFLPDSRGPNFIVDPLGLKHGFLIFGAYLKNIGITTILMLAEE